METNRNDGPTLDEWKGITWWNGLSESERLYWLEMAKSASPADAWAWFKKARPEEVK